MKKYIFLAMVLSVTLFAQNKTNNQNFPLSNSKEYYFDVNKLKLPINNMGVIADLANDKNYYYGYYDDKVFLYSGGFWLSAKFADTLIANAVATASRIQDYNPGKVGSDSADPKNLVYVVNQTDAPFSKSWQDWKDAVSIGADFYDGNKDGIYNPVDLNSNGRWDANEDKPYLIGDATAWTVYNDGVKSGYRRFAQKPVGIEIRQSMFASHTNDGNSNNIVFIRYKILNKTFTQQKLDSVYFTFWADPDLGFYLDDFVGCDTTLNSVYVYNDTLDENNYGTTPPAFFIQMLQGPKAYIPGVTFIDNNNNGVYDEGTDTPLDTAYANLGPDIGVKKYPGAKYQIVKSMNHSQKSEAVLGDPRFEADMRKLRCLLMKQNHPVSMK